MSNRAGYFTAFIHLFLTNIMKKKLFVLLFFLTAHMSFAISTKLLTIEQYNFARSVFCDKFPPREKIILVDHPGKDGRPFVMPVNPAELVRISVQILPVLDIPSVGDGIYMFMTKNMYNDPIKDTYYTKPGQAFVHELTHVWQIYRYDINLVNWITKGIKNDYDYSCVTPTYTKSWSDYNIEQQASMIDRLWANDNRIHECEAFYYSTEISPCTPKTYNILANGTYRIKSTASNNKVLDANASELNKNNYTVALFTNTPNAKEQDWVITQLTNGNYTIKCSANGRFLDANASKVNDNGCPLTLWDYHGGPNQQWIIRSVGNQIYHIRSAATTNEKVIDVVDGKINSDNAKIHLWQSHSGASQVWSFEIVVPPVPPTPVPPTPVPPTPVPPTPVSPPTAATFANGIYTLKLSNGKALDADAAQVNNNGGKIAIWDYAAGAPEQQWILKAVGGGKYTIQVKASNKALDLNASNNVNGGGLTLWDLHGGTNQQWIFTATGSGLYKIQSAFSPYRVVDVEGVAVNTNGAKIHLWDFLNGVNQLWKIEPVVTVVVPPPPPPPAPPTEEAGGQQDYWRWCGKCQTIFHGGGSIAGDIFGKCPTGGGHLVGTRNYILSHGVGTAGQSNWRWCDKCSGLFYNGYPTHGVCPTGGEHNGTNSWNYHLNSAGGQSNFRWCNKCYSMHFGGIKGVCPAGGEHSTVGSGDYSIPFTDPPVIVVPATKEYIERISVGQQLNPGDVLKAANGTHVLVYQTDGNLVVYRNGVAVWHSHTNGQSAGLVPMQGDGNLVIYNAAHQAIWATGTNTCQASFLAMQDDGNLVLYTASGKAVWATGTNSGLTNLGSASGYKLCP
jgi:Ricin-type beta-trefoil lectin domain-like